MRRAPLFFSPRISAPQTDFERLSELDADVPNLHGASDAQIAGLPRARWSGTSADEPCSICLEPLQDGDEFVPSPCAHAHHAACLAQWLKEKKVCPVCKVDLVTGSDAKPAAKPAHCPTRAPRARPP